MSEPRQGSRGGFRRAAAIVGVVALLALAGLYAARKIIAREALAGWLRAHGVTAQAKVEELGLHRFRGRLAAGDPKAPDFVADDAEVTYGLRGLTLEVRSVTLRKATLRARFHAGRLTFGSLDPLIAEFARKPPQPGAPSPRIAIDDGTLLLTTDYGAARVAVDGLIEDGRPVTIAARVGPTRLRGSGFDLAVASATARLATRGDRLTLTLDAPLDSLTATDLTIMAARLQVKADAPYPDLGRRRADGAVFLRAGLAARAATVAGARIDAPVLGLGFNGRLVGAPQDLTAVGAAAVQLRGEAATLGGAQLGAVRASARSDDLRWSRTAPVRVAATTDVSVLVAQAGSGDLRLSNLAASGRGPLRYGPTGLETAMTASLSGRGGWRGLGRVGPGEGPELAALKRAAGDFQVSAPAVSIAWRRGAGGLRLPQPVRVRGKGGATLTLSGAAGRPVVGPNGGAFRLVAGGAGLPEVDAAIRRFRVDRGVFTAAAAVKASGPLGPAQDAAVDAAGVLRIAGGAVSFTADRCIAASVRKVDLGTNDLEQVAGRLCPDGGPVFIAGKGDWRLRGKVRDAQGAAPFLQARIKDAAGAVLVRHSGGELSATADLAGAKMIDAAPQTRFNPLALTGAARLAHAVWTADLRAATPAGQSLAEARLRHDTRTGLGGLTLDTGALDFAEGKLQPVDLSPLAGPLGSPAVGRARFEGRLDWSPQGVTSGGTLRVPGLDFVSPAGKVTGLKGAVVLANLAPLTAKPGQVLTADRIEAVVPITGATATFALDDKALTVAEAGGAVEGGRLRVEDLRVTLASEPTMSGVVAVEGVQLHDLVEASPFADRVDLDARVSGRVPFQGAGGKVRIAGGELHAIQPGRLSISRQALTGVAASGSVSAPTGPPAAVPPNDTFTDFAYQALENLAFDKLDASLASRADGRLGILAHIVGRHDPPQHQEIRLSIFDLIGRKFLNRPLPLPSGTGVNLTLDTTLNLDDLLKDYADYRQLRSSRTVQAPAATTETKPMETPR
ncbi:MAG TPA: YdbH domain-containing protein [Phenylobacterium sp.]